MKLWFGKFKGQELDDVATDYLQMMVRRYADGDEFWGDLSDDLIHEAEEELRSRGERVPYAD